MPSFSKEKCSFGRNCVNDVIANRLILETHGNIHDLGIARLVWTTKKNGL